MVAILVTGFANQATPLDALRMGVRDYLDKNQDLDRETFLHAVNKQLDKHPPGQAAARAERRAWLRSARRSRRFCRWCAAAAALNDPVPLPDAVHVAVPVPAAVHAARPTAS